jgi:cytochrome c oxidase subunit 1
MTFTDAAMQFGYGDTVHLFMGIAGICAIIGSVGARFYVIVSVGTLLVGEKRPDTAPAAVSEEGVEAATTYGSSVPEHGKGLECPGSLVLVFVFFVFLLVYYFANWKYLSTVWGVA